MSRQITLYAPLRNLHERPDRSSPSPPILSRLIYKFNDFGCVESADGHIVGEVEEGWGDWLPFVEKIAGGNSTLEDRHTRTLDHLPFHIPVRRVHADDDSICVETYLFNKDQGSPDGVDLVFQQSFNLYMNSMFATLYPTINEELSPPLLSANSSQLLSSVETSQSANRRQPASIPLSINDLLERGPASQPSNIFRSSVQTDSNTMTYPTTVAGSIPSMQEDQTSSKTASEIHPVFESEMHRDGPESASRSIQSNQETAFITLLGDCRAGNYYNLLCIVTQVNAVQEIRLSRGEYAGNVVLMASILVADQSKAFFPIILWRDHTAWIRKIDVGDVISVKAIEIKLFRDRLSGNTTYNSAVKILHRICRDTPIENDNCKTFCTDKQLYQLLQWAGRQPFLRIRRAALQEIHNDERVVSVVDTSRHTEQSQQKFSSLAALFASRYSGTVLVRTRIACIAFPGLAIAIPHTASQAHHENIAPRELVTCYCKTCTQEAVVDNNGIWRCQQCLPSVQRLDWSFKEAYLMLNDGDNSAFGATSGKIVFGVLAEMFGGMVLPRAFADETFSVTRRMAHFDRFFRMCEQLTHVSSDSLWIKVDVEVKEDMHGFIAGRRVDIRGLDLFSR